VVQRVGLVACTGATQKAKLSSSRGVSKGAARGGGGKDSPALCMVMRSSLRAKTPSLPIPPRTIYSSSQTILQ
jgi:hypothetical protein